MAGSKIRANTITNLNEDGPVEVPFGITQNGQLIGGGGEGSINYVQNSNFDSNILGWELLSGGGAGLSRNTSTPIRGNSSLRITSNGTVRTWKGNIIDLPDAYLGNNKQLFNFSFFARVTGAAAGDFIAYLYDTVNAVKVPGSEVALDPNILQYQLAAMSSDDYEVRIEDVSAADGDTLDLDDVEFGPNPAIIGMSARSPDKAGMIQTFAGDVVPDGWALCDGAEVSQSTYSDLFSRIGTAFNTATNPTTGGAWAAPTAGNFRLPDLRGVFVRGVGTASGVDAVIRGGFQSDINKAHTHTVSGTAASNGAHTHPAASGVGPQLGVRSSGSSGSDFNVAAGAGYTMAQGGVPSAGAHTHTVSGTAASDGGNETRPRNVGMNYIIKLYDDGTVAMLTPSVLGENARLSIHSPTVTSSGTGAGDNTDLNFNTVLKNTGFTYDPATGIGVVLADGDYEFGVTLPVVPGEASKISRIYATINGSTNYFLSVKRIQPGLDEFTGTRILALVKGDTFRFRFNNVNATAAAHTWASTDQCNAYVQRIADRSSRGALGFGLATSDAAGLVFGPQYIVDMSTTGLTNNTLTDIGAGTITLTPGTYLMEYGGEPVISLSTGTPTTAQGILRVTTAANTELLVNATGLALSVGNSDWRSSMATIAELTVATSTTVKLRGLVNVVGGTVTNRIIQKAYIKATRVS